MTASGLPRHSGAASNRERASRVNSTMSSGSTRWDCIWASSSKTRSGMLLCPSRLMLWNGPGAAATARAARRYRDAPVSMTGSLSSPILSPNSATNRAAKES